jgi:hypothetical protein
MLISGLAVFQSDDWYHINSAAVVAATGIETLCNCLWSDLHCVKYIPLSNHVSSAHVLCRCEVLALFRHAHLGSFMEPKDIKRKPLGAIWRFSKAAGLP